jgi:hypothetical protein
VCSTCSFLLYLGIYFCTSRLGLNIHSVFVPGIFLSLNYILIMLIRRTPVALRFAPECLRSKLERPHSLIYNTSRQLQMIRRKAGGTVKIARFLVWINPTFAQRVNFLADKPSKTASKVMAWHLEHTFEGNSMQTTQWPHKISALPHSINYNADNAMHWLHGPREIHVNSEYKPNHQHYHHLDGPLFSD